MLLQREGSHERGFSSYRTRVAVTEKDFGLAVVLVPYRRKF